MNQEQVEMLAQRLMRSQEQFFTTVKMLMNVFQRFRESQQSFNEALEAREIWYEAEREASRLQREMIDKILESNTALYKAYQDTQAAVQQNTERMEKLLAKVEAYFGTTGLDYDN